MIDSGGCGRDIDDLVFYGPAVFNGDPQKNIIFSIHIYGNVQAGQASAVLKSLHQSGLPIVVGEFGPGRNIRPSPTTLTPGELITAAENLGIGWMAWSWDNNNLSGPGPPQSDDNGFAMVYSNYNQNPGPPYNGFFTCSPSALSTFGNNVVLGLPGPLGGNAAGYDLWHLSTPASIYAGMSFGGTCSYTCNVNGADTCG